MVSYLIIFALREINSLEAAPAMCGASSSPSVGCSSAVVGTPPHVLLRPGRHAASSATVGPPEAAAATVPRPETPPSILKPLLFSFETKMLGPCVLSPPQGTSCFVFHKFLFRIKLLILLSKIAKIHAWNQLKSYKNSPISTQNFLDVTKKP